MEQPVQESLVRIFGEKDVSFDRVERKLYSHDVGSVPRLIKPFMPGGLAGAVVRPRSEGSLVELLGLARSNGLEVVPRLSLIHISEPTRLLSISYAVFCLKK